MLPHGSQALLVDMRQTHADRACLFLRWEAGVQMGALPARQNYNHLAGSALQLAMTSGNVTLVRVVWL